MTELSAKEKRAGRLENLYQQAIREDFNLPELKQFIKVVQQMNDEAVSLEQEEAKQEEPKSIEQAAFKEKMNQVFDILNYLLPIANEYQLRALTRIGPEVNRVALKRLYEFEEEAEEDETEDLEYEELDDDPLNNGK